VERLIRHDGGLFFALTEQLLAEGYSVRFRAEGTSMLPTIGDGDTITIAPGDGRTIQPGDIVLYRLGDRALAHRIVEVRDDPSFGLVLVPQGDGKSATDAPITPGQIIGKIVDIRLPRRSKRTAATLLGRVSRILRKAALKR
jgi:signal peptidase I